MMGMLAIAGAFGMAVPAMAQDWTFVTESDAGSVHYYDSASLKRSGGKVTFWSREDARNADVEDDYPLVSDALEEIDCAADKLRLIEIVDRDDQYQEVERFDFRSEVVWNAIAPNTVAASKRSAVCK
ncbi:surface-adhesin E family protein [Sphingopyxis sp. QXT-31]|uniref:surface-adhesin E family protein n=1 Tax=Sphingopyxis sp. QXT-31 TaxID=1357916 RepID=UPI0012EB5E15|nr:surface-adhesin E family protein [Sphingopyxis sp. QXT-31]